MAEKENNTKKINELLAQRKVLRAIIEKGIRFTVNYTVKTRQKGLKGLLWKKVYEERKEEFVIKEATLNTLDRASEVWLRMDTSAADREGAGDKENWMLAKASAKDMAECLAILVLGERYWAVDGGDEEELKRLTELFYKTVKPSQANDIAMFINTAANLADFANSIRLMKMSITTTPTTRIE